MPMPILKLSAPQALLCDLLGACWPKAREKAVRRFIATLGDKNAFSLAQANEVSSVVAHALMDAYGVENVPAHWIKVHEENYTRIAAYLDELDRIAKLLDKEGIQLVVLKNGGIARGIYHCPGCCPMGDLDVLIERRHFRHAHKILLDDGYQFEFRSPLEKAKLAAAEKGGGAEYWKILPGGEKLWFELQWRPVAGRWIRPDQEPDSEELMSRSVPIPGSAVRLLSPEDNLFQATLHTAKHSYVRAPGFRLHLDVVRIVRYQAIVWDMFLKRVIELEVRTAVYFSLVIPKLIFGTPIPDEIMKQLKPAIWKEQLIGRCLQRAGLFNPDEKKFSRLMYITFNALLYDDLNGLIKGIIPDSGWMRDKYGIEAKNCVLAFYLKRLKDMAFRRLRT